MPTAIAIFKFFYLWFCLSVFVGACYSILRSIEKSWEEEFTQPLTSIEQRRLGNQ